MQSLKKCRREPRIKATAHLFAMPYAMNVGEIVKAINNAMHLEQVSRSKASEIDEKKFPDNKRSLVHTANFWLNVSCILKKRLKSERQGKKNGLNRS